MDEGAFTLNARTEREQTITLPNHTGMLTGRRIDADHGGHGVTWNDERLHPRTVQEAAGHPVASVFTVVDSPERDTALFASKQKFTLFDRSWPKAIDKFVLREDNARLVRRVRADIGRPRARLPLRAPLRARRRRSRRGLHVAGLPRRGGGQRPPDRPDPGGRRARTPAWLATPWSSSPPTTAATAPATATRPGSANYRVPFLVWGAGVTHDTTSTTSTATTPTPAGRRTTYAADRQPVRNGDVANLATDLLGLGRSRAASTTPRRTSTSADASGYAQSWPSRRSSASSTVPS